MMLGPWSYKLKNNIITDFSFMNAGTTFPSEGLRYRNTEYRFREKEYSGKYDSNRYLTVKVGKNDKDVPYQRIGLNYFRLMTNKLVDLIMNNDISIKTDDIETDAKLSKLVEKTKWVKGIREALKLVTIYGDAYVKTYKEGVSVFSPTKAFKVVDKNNINNEKAIVLVSYLFDDKVYGQGISLVDRMPEFIRFEIHFEGKIFEIVKRYHGGYYAGKIGNSVDYKSEARDIKGEGIWYNTDINDCKLVQCLSINKNLNGIYGESIYQDIQDLVFAIEQRVSLEHYALNNLVEPLLIVGMSSVIETEDGGYKLKTINGNMMVTDDRNNDKSIIPQQFQQEYKLDNYETFIDTLKSELYELSEMGKIFLTSEYSGNISEESITNLIKSAIDKSNRIISEVYYEIRDSLYALARLNGIDIEKDVITINFNIGQTDNDGAIAEICKTLSDSGILSKTTLRQRYFGYSLEQSNNEQMLINIENGGVETDNAYKEESNETN